jgi:RHS repeat-associated protein
LILGKTPKHCIGEIIQGLRARCSIYAGNTSYRYGFNGKENDDEVYGDDNEQDYGMRIYDPRLGRFLSVDPIAREYPELTPYQFASNTPIMAVDLDGLEKAPANYVFNKELYTSYLALKKYNSVLQMKQIKALESRMDRVENILGSTSKARFNFGQVSVFVDYYKQNALKSSKDRKDCISVLCAATNLILDTQLDPKDKNIAPNGSIHEVAIYLQGKGLMGPAIEVGFTEQQDGSFVMNESLGTKMLEAIGDKEGYFGFYLSFAQGYHSMAVFVDKTGIDKDYPKFYLGDQGTVVDTRVGLGWSKGTQNIASEFDEFVRIYNGFPTSGFINQARNHPTKPYNAPKATAWLMIRKQ